MPSIPALHFIILAPLLCIPARYAGAADAASPGYVHDTASTVVRSAFGTCWRTGVWTPRDAVIGCDGVLQSPVARITAPPLLVVVPPEAAPAAPPPQRCDYTLTLAGDDTFDFDNTRLRQQTKAHIDARLIEPLADCVTERVQITGHADRLGTARYNQRLSEKRAGAVAAYLASRGISANYDIRGAGSSEPLVTCDSKMKLSARIACLAPNRRVVIQTFGISNN